jgi:hypothetical protein
VLSSSPYIIWYFGFDFDFGFILLRKEGLSLLHIRNLLIIFLSTSSKCCLSSVESLLFANDFTTAVLAPTNPFCS